MSTPSQSHSAYVAAGVDIDAGNTFVERIKGALQSTHRTGVMGEVGGFAGFFDTKAAGFKDPLLVACTDGVGTKVKIASETGNFRGIGQDLVAMCVNDLVVCGAQPLFFLDYFATSKLDIAVAAVVVEGVAAACKASGCALIGGETAEMPGVYAAGDLDMAGFAVGAVERGQQLNPRDNVAAGDVLLGLASSGVHSNGFSLVRYLVSKHNLKWSDKAPFATDTLGDALLTPTRLYVQAVLAAIRAGGVVAAAHITGGGFTDNLPRVLPAHLTAAVQVDTWPRLPVFEWLQQIGNLTEEEMLRTFNAGIGMVLVVRANCVAAVTTALEQAGERVYRIGEVIERVAGEGQVHYS